MSMIKAIQQRKFQLVDQIGFRNLLSRIDSNYLTACPPGFEEICPLPSCAFYFIRALFSWLLLGEIFYQFVDDWQMYARNRYSNGLNYTLNITCMLMVQCFGLMGIWGPKLSHLAIFVFMRFNMTIDLLCKDDLYGMTHLTMTIYATVYIAMCWNILDLGSYVSDLLNLLAPIHAPTTNFEPFSRQSYSLVRFNLIFLMFASILLDILDRIISQNVKLGYLIVYGILINGFTLYGLMSVYNGHFFRLLIFVWFHFFSYFGVLFTFNLEVLLSFTVFVYGLFLAYMIWKIAGKPFILKNQDH